MTKHKKTADNASELSIDAQILLVENEITKVRNRYAKIESDFLKRRTHHENFAIVCMVSIVGWSLYPFEGIAFLIDLSVVSAQKSILDDKFQALSEKFSDLQTQKKIEQLPKNSGNQNCLFNQKHTSDKKIENSLQATP
ncbi:MAG: hypothetical protein EPN84_11065 [Legionella sp.]|nr:MAG: hypothetical protein EPN84_11065 [Legionella sp.]